MQVKGSYNKILATTRRNSGEDEIKALETMATHAKGGWKWFEDRQGTLACAEEKVASWEAHGSPLLKIRVGLFYLH
jgi:hypothetical protein